MPMTLVLVITALGVVVAIPAMRYLAIDNAREDQVRVVRGELDNAQSERARYVVLRNSLSRKAHLTPAQRQSLATLISRITSDDAQITALQTSVEAVAKPRGADRAVIAIPLFFALNLFLFAVATAISYYHYDPAADRRSAMRRAERAFARRNAVRGFFARRAEKREMRAQTRMARRDDGRRAKQRERAQAEQDVRELELRRLSVLEANAETVDSALTEMERVYSAAVGETHDTYRTLINRYWSEQNQRGMRRARKLATAWRKSVLRATKRGKATPEQPPGIDWQRPVSQDVALPFQSFDELGFGTVGTAGSISNERA